MNRAPAQPIVLAPPAVFAPPFVVGDASDEDAQVKKKINEIKMVQHAVQHKLEKNVWEKKNQSVRQTGCCHGNPAKMLF